MYLTKNYQDKDLTGINLSENDLTNWNLSRQNLTNVSFSNTNLTDTNLTDSNISYVDFSNTTSYGFTKEQLYSTASYKNKNLTGIKLISNHLISWDFSGQDLTNSSFLSSDIRGADFTNSIINYVDFIVDPSVYYSITKEQLYSTASYRNKDLTGIKLGYDYSFSSKKDLSMWDFSGQNLMNSSFSYVQLSNANFTETDLRGSIMKEIEGYVITKNTIMSDGTIQNFSMVSADDSFSIRKYTPAEMDGPLISAKIGKSASISNGANLTLETGACLDVTVGAILTVSNDSFILINTDVDGSTSFNIASNAGLTFKNGAILRINVEESIIVSDTYKFAVMSWDESSNIVGLSDFIIDETLFLSLNGENFDGVWNYSIENGNLMISMQVPEPSVCATIFGVLAITFAAYHRKK